MATIFFNSSQTVTGTSSTDVMVGNDPSGINTNDIVYGLQGDDTITAFSLGLTSSTLYGGQGNDSVTVAVNNNVVYGNFGNDTLKVYGNPSIYAFNNTVYGGQDDDGLFSQSSERAVLYGNQGNDTIEMDNSFFQTAYGGQGNDFIRESFSSYNVLYGNQGNDVLRDEAPLAPTGPRSAGTSVLYGGQGDDTLSAIEAGGDTMYGGLGNDLFAANEGLLPGELTANDLLTVEDFVSGQDRLSLSTDLSAQATLLFKLDDPFVNNADDALSAANATYSTSPPVSNTNPFYLFIYGGSGAGYLFYNGDFGGSLPNDGMVLVGDNGEASLSANDIVASVWAG